MLWIRSWKIGLQFLRRSFTMKKTEAKWVNLINILSIVNNVNILSIFLIFQYHWHIFGATWDIDCCSQVDLSSLDSKLQGEYEARLKAEVIMSQIWTRLIWVEFIISQQVQCRPSDCKLTLVNLKIGDILAFTNEWYEL